jgi:hypothetical protein
VFVAAEGRGMGDLMAQYFDRLNPGGRELYEEYSEIPPPESLERQAKGVETVIPDPDRLMPPELRLGLIKGGDSETAAFFSGMNVHGRSFLS